MSPSRLRQFLEKTPAAPLRQPRARKALAQALEDTAWHAEAHDPIIGPHLLVLALGLWSHNRYWGAISGRDPEGTVIALLAAGARADLSTPTHSSALEWFLKVHPPNPPAASEHAPPPLSLTRRLFAQADFADPAVARVVDAFLARIQSPGPALPQATRWLRDQRARVLAHARLDASLPAAASCPPPRL